MNVLLKLLIWGFAVYIADNLLPGVSADSFMTGIVVAVVLGLVNTIVTPLLFFFTLPLTVLTFGLFAFIVNAMGVLFVDTLIPGFKVDSLLWAVGFSVILSLVNYSLKTLGK